MVFQQPMSGTVEFFLAYAPVLFFCAADFAVIAAGAEAFGGKRGGLALAYLMAAMISALLFWGGRELNLWLDGEQAERAFLERQLGATSVDLTDCEKQLSHCRGRATGSGGSGF